MKTSTKQTLSAIGLLLLDTGIFIGILIESGIFTALGFLFLNHCILANSHAIAKKSQIRFQTDNDLEDVSTNVENCNVTFHYFNEEDEKWSEE